MDRAKLLEVLTDVLAEVLLVPPESVTESSRFREDLAADSIDLLEITLRCQRRLNAALPEEEAYDIVTVGHALDAMSRAVVNRPGSGGGSAL